MTRKHFQALAKALKLSRPDIESDEMAEHWKAEQWKYTVREVATACYDQADGNFVYERFYTACGYND